MAASSDSTAAVVNVRVASLRAMGYGSLQEWLDAAPGKHVYIGRANCHVPGALASKWANPFPVGRYGRDGCIAEFEAYIKGNPALLAQLPELKGCILGCWCKPEACHGDVLARLVDALP